MRGFAIAAGILVALAIAAFVAYRLIVPRLFVAAGRGAINDSALVRVTRVAHAESTLDYKGQTVQSGPNHRYVIIDCQIDAPADKVDFDDFQLVKDKAPSLGAEENVGSNADRDYFYWSFIDGSGHPVAEVPASSAPLRARLSFKVPRDAKSGYLFYWGFYWGPLELGQP